MSKRINVVLPDATIEVLDRVAPKGDRSQFISRKQSLRAQLKAGYEASAERDLKIAIEWFPLEEEARRGRYNFRAGPRTPILRIRAT